MTSELSKYLNKQVGLFLNVKQQKWSHLKTLEKLIFKQKRFCIMWYLIKYLRYLSFWKFRTFLLKVFIKLIVTPFRFSWVNEIIVLNIAKSFGDTKIPLTARKMELSIKGFFCNCDQIHRKLLIWSDLPKKPLIEDFIFWAVSLSSLKS